MNVCYANLYLLGLNGQREILYLDLLRWGFYIEGKGWALFLYLYYCVPVSLTYRFKEGSCILYFKRCNLCVCLDANFSDFYQVLET